jgi:hypothetical protein
VIVSDQLSSDEAMQLCEIRVHMAEARRLMARLTASLATRHGSVHECYRLFDVVPKLNEAITALDMGLRGKETPL